MLKGYAPEDIADNYNKYTSSQEGKSMQAKLSLYLFQVNALPYIYIHVYISADKCFEVNNTEKNEKSNINADLEITSTQHSRARLVLILIHDCYFIVTIIICEVLKNTSTSV